MNVCKIYQSEYQYEENKTRVNDSQKMGKTSFVERKNSFTSESFGFQFNV